MNNLAESINEHSSEEDNVDGIIDHITGYKKIIDFTLIEWRTFKLLINYKYITLNSITLLINNIQNYPNKIVN